MDPKRQFICLLMCKILTVIFTAITGHKLYGPSGSGAIYIKPERMAEMRPFMGGGDMIRDVGREVITYNDAPMKFEAGTPAIVQQIGLGVALDYMMDIGMEDIASHEKASICDYARERLDGLNWLNSPREFSQQSCHIFVHLKRCRACA